MKFIITDRCTRIARVLVLVVVTVPLVHALIWEHDKILGALSSFMLVGALVIPWYRYFSKAAV